MKKLFTKGRITLLVIFSVLIIDQIIKIWVKTHMYMHQRFQITEWFEIYFTQNNGMAFGMEIFGHKLFLTAFRIVAVALIGWYLHRIIKREFKLGYIICVALILAGAMGNIIDSVFYGVIFNDPDSPQVATFVWGDGYTSWFQGKVVDMFYFPIIKSSWPMWIPKIGGNPFVFFSPIFNFADAAISCGIIALLLFYSKYLNESYHSLDKDKKEATDHEK